MSGERVGILPLVADSATADSITTSQKSLSNVDSTAAPIDKLISEVSELKTAIADIKSKMTNVPIDDLLNFSDKSPPLQSAPDIPLRSKVLPPAVPARLTKLSDNLVAATDSRRPVKQATLYEIIIGVALIGALGAAILSLSIIDNVLAEYCVIGTYAINKFYIMYMSNNTPKYTKCVFMIMAAALLFQSAFLVAVLFRLFDKPSHLYSSISSLIDVSASWVLSRL